MVVQLNIGNGPSVFYWAVSCPVTDCMVPRVAENIVAMISLGLSFLTSCEPRDKSDSHELARQCDVTIDLPAWNAKYPPNPKAPRRTSAFLEERFRQRCQNEQIINK
eukprot:4940596-Amphidinium_carterae.1